MDNIYDETKDGYAARAYQTLIATLDKMQWKYVHNDKNRTISTTAIGKDMPMILNIGVDTTRQIMCAKSPMPFNIPEDARETISHAVNIANYSFLNGCFEYNHNDGILKFRIVIPFEGCIVSQEVCKYFILLTCQMVDKFNDKFLKLAQGQMTLEEFENFATQN